MVQKLEQNVRRSARISTLSALARVLGVPVGVLLGDRSAGELARQGHEAAEAQPSRATLLRTLIAKRHWQRFQTFEAQFRRAARELAEREGEPDLAKLTVSPRQWERWYAGNVKTEPYPDACRVLEHMFGYPIQVLLAPVSQIITNNQLSGTHSSLVLAGTPNVPISEGVFTDTVRRGSDGHQLQIEIAGHAPISTSIRRSITATDIEAVEEFTRTFRRLDNKFGGGHAHALALQYLDSSVTTMLREGSYTDEVGQRLLRAAAQLAHLIGWTAYDITDHSCAELYFGNAIDFSIAAGDIAFGGEILAAKSHHAIHLQRPREALELARASESAAKVAAIPALQAEACALEANVYAVLGDAKACISSLHRAETAFDRSREENTPEWLRYLDEGYLAARFAHCFRDLKNWSQARGFASRAAGMSNTLTRSRAFNVTVLATTYVETDLDHACRVGIEALNLATGLQSARMISYIRNFQQLLADQHANEPIVGEFTERANQMLGVT